MSNYFGVGSELLYAYYGAATTSVPTAAPVTITATYPAIVIPAGFFKALGKQSSSLKLKLGGFLVATATVPTFSFGIGLSAFSTSPAFSTSLILATASNAVAPTAGSGAFKMEVEIGLRTLGIGAASTIVTHGAIDCNLITANMQLASGGSGNTFATYQDDNEYYLWPYLTLSAATAGNTVTTQYAKLYGEN